METKWYVIRIVTGKEKKAIVQLNSEIKARGFSNKVKNIIIPTEKTYHIRKGKRIEVEKNHYPGYVLIETNPDIIGELKDIHKSSSYVSGFLGGDNPQPLRNDEVKRILNKLDEMESGDNVAEDIFVVGETVNIIDGPFNSFSGMVKQIVPEKHKIKLDVKIFGRNTPLELSFAQVERVY